MPVFLSSARLFLQGDAAYQISKMLCQDNVIVRPGKFCIRRWTRRARDRRHTSSKLAAGERFCVTLSELTQTRAALDPACWRRHTRHSSGCWRLSSKPSRPLAARSSSDRAVGCGDFAHGLILWHALTWSPHRTNHRACFSLSRPVGGGAPGARAAAGVPHRGQRRGHAARHAARARL